MVVAILGGIGLKAFFERVKTEQKPELKQWAINPSRKSEFLAEKTESEMPWKVEVCLLCLRHSKETRQTMQTNGFPP